MSTFTSHKTQKKKVRFLFVSSTGTASMFSFLEMSRLLMVGGTLDT